MGFLSMESVSGRPARTQLRSWEPGAAVHAGWGDRLLGFRQQVGLMAQGFQRALDANKRVVALDAPHPKLLVRPVPAVPCAGLGSRGFGRRKGPACKLAPSALPNPLSAPPPRLTPRTPSCLQDTPLCCAFSATLCCTRCAHSSVRPLARTSAGTALLPGLPEVPHADPHPLDLSPKPLQAGLGLQTSVFLSDVEADGWAPGTVANLSARSARWLVTRGELGADEIVDGQLTVLHPEKVR